MFPKKLRVKELAHGRLASTAGNGKAWAKPVGTTPQHQERPPVSAPGGSALHTRRIATSSSQSGPSQDIRGLPRDTSLSTSDRRVSPWEKYLSTHRREPFS